MFGIGGFEFVIIIIFGFLIIGPDRFPQIARTLGKALRTFQNARAEVSEVVRNDIYDPNADDPFKDPLVAIDKVSDITKKAGSSLKEDFSKEKDRQRAEKKAAVAKAKEEKAAAEATETTAPAAAPVAEAKPAEAAAPVRTESFTERRARYERERAAKIEAAKANANAEGKEE